MQIANSSWDTNLKGWIVSAEYCEALCHCLDNRRLTERNYSSISFDPALTTDDTVAIEYYAGSSCQFRDDYLTESVRYQWQGDHVQQLDEIPNWPLWEPMP